MSRLIPHRRCGELAKIHLGRSGVCRYCCRLVTYPGAVAVQTLFEGRRISSESCPTGRCGTVTRLRKTQCQSSVDDGVEKAGAAYDDFAS